MSKTAIDGKGMKITAKSIIPVYPIPQSIVRRTAAPCLTGTDSLSHFIIGNKRFIKRPRTLPNSPTANANALKTNK